MSTIQFQNLKALSPAQKRAFNLYSEVFDSEDFCFARLWLYVIIAAHGMLMILLIVAGVFSLLLTLIVLI